MLHIVQVPEQCSQLGVAHPRQRGIRPHPVHGIPKLPGLVRRTLCNDDDEDDDDDDRSDEPTSTSVLQIPIEHIIFPAVTICPLSGSGVENWTFEFYFLWSTLF